MTEQAPGRRSAGATPAPISTFARSALRGSTGLGASYADRSWDVDDLAGLLRRLLRWGRPLLYLESRRIAAVEPFRRDVYHRPSHEDDRANIAHHYDLPPEWFALVLDADMSYSCAIYPGPDSSLDEAAAHKVERVCQVLGLRDGSRLLDIGCGWGALTMAAVERHGAHVTATTLSREQWAYVGDKVARASLDGQVRLLCDHYEQLTGTYDAIASIEMIEALDWRRQREVLARCRQLLEPDGRFLLQAITVRDAHHQRAKHRDDFAKNFIFPGGCLPSRRSLEHDLQAADLEVVDVVSIGQHYARTLADWRRNLEANWETAVGMGTPDRFLRMWRFYLAYCEAGFRERYLDDYQFLVKPR